LGFEEGEEIGDGDVAGEDVISNVGDMTAAIMRGRLSLPAQTAFCAESVCFVSDAKAGGSSLASKPQIAPNVYCQQAQEQILAINICSRDSLNSH